MKSVNSRYPLVRSASLALVLLLTGAVPGAAADDSEPAFRDPARVLRIATFNAFLNRTAAGRLIEDLASAHDQMDPNGDGSDLQIRAVAEIVQRVRPDVLLLNEFDFDEHGVALELFERNFLGVSQNGARPIRYRHLFSRPSNTGLPSGLDLNNDGVVGGPDDAYGFGLFEGQFGMALLSRYPVLTRYARTFQNFRWADMPGALLPGDPHDADGNGDTANWFTAAELEQVRLSSKSHWDVPILVGRKVVHILAAHPTPPVFDGAEDRNGRRNHDEIRFWADYVTPGRGGYIYDDRDGGPGGASGGLPAGARFVILGDYNADPLDGDSTGGAINQLLVNLQIADPKPSSRGSAEDALLEGMANDAQRAEAATDTADFNPAGPGNLRVDFALPSTNLRVVPYAWSRHLPCADCRGVFWPGTDDRLRYLVGDGFPVVSSDHHLVWIDLAVAQYRDNDDSDDRWDPDD